MAEVKRTAPIASADATESEPTRARTRLLRVLLVGIAVAVVGAVLLTLGRTAGAYVPVFANWVEGLGIWGPVVFIVGYAAAIIGFVPGSVLTIAAGAIFGLVRGTLFVFVAALLGCTGSFVIARYLARGAIEKRLEGNKQFSAIDHAVGEQGRKIVFLLRLSPAFPFVLLNYGLGLTRVRLIDYVVASVGMLPGTMLYVYTGKAVGDVAAAVGGAAPGQGAGYYAVLFLGLLATLAVTVFVTRIARRALREATGGRDAEEI